MTRSMYFFPRYNGGFNDCKDATNEVPDIVALKIQKKNSTELITSSHRSQKKITNWAEFLWRQGILTDQNLKEKIG